MKQHTWRGAIVALAVLATILVSPHFRGLAPAQSYKEVKAATGPFTYDPAVVGSVTYIGDAGEAVTGTVEICAPGGGPIFPAGDSSATADMRVFGIEQVSDVDGQPLDEPLEVPLDSPLGMSLVQAFSLAPDSYTFFPGDCVDINVTVHNPTVDDAYYGDYVVTIKAQAVGSGIGVGSGARYHLSLRGATDTDTTLPTVMIISPSDGSSHLLGVLSVKITAIDPVPGTGVDTIRATVSSAGGAVSNEAMALTDNAPQPAGSLVTATGTLSRPAARGRSGPR